ncbi:MAG: chorismate mutase, partial [Fusobacteriaceae bacterium]
MEVELGKLRENIDSIDKQILELILKRVECVEKVGELKGKNNFRIYVPERENSIFKNLYEVAGK